MPIVILVYLLIDAYVLLTPLAFLMVALFLLESKIMKLLVTLFSLPFWYLFSFTHAPQYLKVIALSCLFLIIPISKIIDSKIEKNIKEDKSNWSKKVNSIDLDIDNFLNRQSTQKINSYFVQYFVQIGIYLFAFFIEWFILITQRHSIYSIVDMYFEFTKAYKPAISEYYHASFVVLFVYIFISTIIYFLKNYNKLFSIKTVLVLIIPILAFYDTPSLIIIALYAYIFNNFALKSVQNN